MYRIPLPEEFAATAFAVSEARADGIPANRLRSRRLARPFHGIRSPNPPEEGVLARCAQLAPRLRGHQIFSHLSAAAIWELPLPAWCAYRPLEVCALWGAREPRTEGVIGHRHTFDATEVTLVHGMPVPPPALVWAQCAEHLALEDLIAMADAILSRGMAAPDELAASIRRGHRGAVTARAALAEARAGSESPRETFTRLALVRAGLPEPELNIDLRRSDGRFVARLDLAYRRWKVCVEYDGRQHSTGLQFARDADRWSDIAAEGWLIVRVLAHHFDDPNHGIVARTRAALASRGYPD
ncbi:MAG: hypothetical protein J0I43_11835 [Microbacterium sp.]|uniref:hypothetical protein n=1 Tax=Microbacterium sp. TaxID=51671 RepID=UPI001ACC056E|nr:hypothetical protein [Microbacterium sp.]MBN9178039.1 hypothetical protein [Microbacterium sp.]